MPRRRREHMRHHFAGEAFACGVRVLVTRFVVQADQVELLDAHFRHMGADALGELLVLKRRVEVVRIAAFARQLRRPAVRADEEGLAINDRFHRGENLV